MRRFTATEKWDDAWFRSLHGHYKLAFLYILDRCDNAGFWEVDLDSMQFHTKLSHEHCEGAIKGLARGLQGADGWVWVKNFLRHQKNDSLNPINPAHRQIIALIERHSGKFPDSKNLLPEGACKGLQSPIGKGNGKVKVKVSFLKPTLEEVIEYGSTLTPPLKTAHKFLSFHESKGWKVGRSPMVDWKAAVRTWHSNEGEFNLGGKPTGGKHAGITSGGFTGEEF